MVFLPGLAVLVLTLTFEKVKGHKKAATEKVPQVGYSSLFPCRQADGYLIDLKHRIMPDSSESSEGLIQV